MMKFLLSMWAAVLLSLCCCRCCVVLLLSSAMCEELDSIVLMMAAVYQSCCEGSVKAMAGSFVKVDGFLVLLSMTSRGSTLHHISLDQLAIYYPKLQHQNFLRYFDG
jgi:hypothetical protein